jgi:hypothetical protein
MSRLRALFITQAQFEAWANAAKRWHLYALAMALLFIAVACIAANVLMGPRLVREGTLLWFGTHTEGTVRQTTLDEAGKFKGGAPKYRLTIDYRFAAADGTHHDGTTIRTDVRYPPDLPPGAPIGVYYSPANPANSVAEHNLRTDVYALLLFLPFLAVVGIGWPVFWSFRMWRWHRRRRFAAP